MALSVVYVSDGQYRVIGGGIDDLAPGRASLPGVASGIGQESFFVTTGLEFGHLRVRTDALSNPPDLVTEGWDVIAEVDIRAPSGSILVYDMFGGPSEGLTDLAVAGPGLYRVRIHARNREPVEERDSTEAHWLIAWPVAQRSAPKMLTSLDTYGRLLTGELKLAQPELDEVDAAVSSAVEVLAQMVESGVRPSVSGEQVALRHQRVIDAPIQEVREVVSSPIAWLGVGGSPGFEVIFSSSHLRADNPGQLLRQVRARGKVVLDERNRVSFTWAWLVPALPPSQEPDLKRRLDLLLHGIPFPEPPELVEVRLAELGSSTDVDVTITRVPVEYAGVADAVWAWAMKRLARRATKQPAQMLAWGNYY